MLTVWESERFNQNKRGVVEGSSSRVLLKSRVEFECMCVCACAIYRRLNSCDFSECVIFIQSPAILCTALSRPSSPSSVQFRWLLMKSEFSIRVFLSGDLDMQYIFERSRCINIKFSYISVVGVLKVFNYRELVHYLCC